VISIITSLIVIPRITLAIMLEERSFDEVALTANKDNSRVSALRLACQSRSRAEQKRSARPNASRMAHACVRSQINYLRDRSTTVGAFQWALCVE